MNFTTKTFSELTTKELYKILQLRSEVFVVEQEILSTLVPCLPPSNSVARKISKNQ